MTANKTEQPRVVSQTEWLENRKKLLEKEKELTRLSDRVSAQRRDLPWVKVDKKYVFDGPRGSRRWPIFSADEGS